MAWTAPVAGIPATVITAAWSTANVVNPLNWLRGLTGNGDPPAADYVAVSTGPTSTSWQKVGTAVIADGAVTNDKLGLGAVGVNQLGNGAVTLAKLAASVAVVPSGLVAWFETLAELTAAGAGWARYTAADGRLLIGAGTTFSQAFTQATNYGSTWAVAVPAHTHDLGATVNIDLDDTGDATVTLGTVTSGVSSGASTTTFISPSRAGVWGRKS
jgi:hypothetical protein